MLLAQVRRLLGRRLEQIFHDLEHLLGRDNPGH
jgi:hypothetical protein